MEQKEREVIPIGNIWRIKGNDEIRYLRVDSSMIPAIYQNPDYFVSVAVTGKTAGQPVITSVISSQLEDLGRAEV